MKALGRQKQRYVACKDKEQRLQKQKEHEAYLASLSEEERKEVLAKERAERQKLKDALPSITNCFDAEPYRLV